jgi:hypothetical protein
MSRLPNMIAVITLIALAACTRADVRTVQPYYGPAMPRPDHVFVAYFAISPDQVRLDQGIGARITRVAEDHPMGADEWQVAQTTQAALAARLAERLTSYGLPAAVGEATAEPGNNLLVQGQIVGVDQGNRTRRVLIGLGAGKSTVSADTQLYYLSAGAPPRFVSAFEGQADSGRMPGAAETMGAGAAAGTLATSAVASGALHGTAEVRRAGDTAEARRLADELARQIGTFAVAQGWILPAALQR